jgi:outer membrane protein
MKKLIPQLLLLLCALTYVSSSFAEPVYLIDMQKVISDSIVGKAAKNDMESELKKREGQLTKLQNDLKAMKEELDKQSSVLAKDALKTKQEAFVRKEREFQKSFQENREALAKKNNEAISGIVKQVDEIVKNMAKENDYKLVLEKDQRLVIYSSSEYDLTEEVIKKLDAKKLGS